MIGAVLMLVDVVIEVNVKGNEIYFRTSDHGANPPWAPFEGLRLSYEGVVKEHPDLKGSPHWQEEARIRFKDKVRSYKTERQKINYILEDLKSHGYLPKYIQRAGWRPEKL